MITREFDRYQLIRTAYKRGREDTALELAQAWNLFIETDDIDTLRDALTDLLPADYVAPVPKDPDD